jgi:hypothetical protein
MGVPTAIHGNVDLVANQKNESTATRTELEQGTCAALTKMEFQLIFGNVRNVSGVSAAAKRDAASIVAKNSPERMRNPKAAGFFFQRNRVPFA